MALAMQRGRASGGGWRARTPPPGTSKDGGWGADYEHPLGFFPGRGGFWGGRQFRLQTAPGFSEALPAKEVGGPTSKTTNKFFSEVRARAIRMVLSHEGKMTPQSAAVRSRVYSRLGSFKVVREFQKTRGLAPQPKNKQPCKTLNCKPVHLFNKVPPCR